MKKFISILALVLSLCLTLSFVGCEKDSNTASADTEEKKQTISDIAGTYELDGANWGMNLKWYITINADSTFTIVTEKGVAKGDGTVSGKDGTWMLIYSDSTAEKSKTATFTYADGKITFSTSVPIGIATISSNDEHPENVYATKTEFTPATGISYEKGSYTATAADGTVYYLTVNEDKTYTLVSDKGLNKSGSFETTDTQLTSADFTATVASRILTAELTDGKLALTFYHSTIQGNFKAESTDSSAYAATLKIEGANFVLKTGTSDALDYLETKGTITTKDNYMYLAFESGETTLVCVVSANDISVADVPVAKDVKTSMSFKAYTPEEKPAADASLAGTYTGSYDKMGMGSSIHYDMTLVIGEDGTYIYSSAFVMGSSAYAYAEQGTAVADGSVIRFKALKKVTSANITTGILTDIAAENQKEVVGTVTDGVISSGMFLSPMSASTVSVTLTKVNPYGSYAATYQKMAMGSVTEYTLDLKVNEDGTFVYSSAFAMGGSTYYYGETGTVSVEGAVVKFKATKKVTSADMTTGALSDIAAADQAEVAGTYADSKLTVSFKTSPMASAAVSLTFEKK